MNNNKKNETELMTDLESAYKKVYGAEARPKAPGRVVWNKAGRYKTLSGLRDSEERYRRLFETAQDGILLLDAESGAITDANPFLANLLGYAEEELIGKRLWEIGAFVDVKDSKVAFEKLQRKKYIRYEDLPLKTKAGQSREVEFVSNVYLVNGKKIIQCNIRDITARKHTEDSLRESEERYRRLFETAHDGILLLDAGSGAITDANPFIITMLGYAPEELIGKRLWEIGAFVDVKDSKTAFEKLQRKKYIRYEDLPLKTKEGKSREVEFISNVYLVNGKKIIQCNIRDITARKHTEDSLRESEERYRRLFETAKDGILLLDAKSGAITDANPFIITMLGYALEELIGKRLWEMGAFVDVKDSKVAFEKLQRKKYIRYEDLPLKTKEGKSREVEFVSNVYLANGKKIIQCNIRDITARKHTENSLRESEERYRRLFETAQDGILLLDAESGAITDANPFIAKLLGYTLEELIGKRLWEIGVFVDIKESKAAFKELQRKKYIRYEDLPLQTKTKETRQVEFVSNVYLVNGKKVIQCNIRDITDRKRLEEDLTHIFNVALDMLCVADFSGRFVRLSSMWSKTLGWTDEELKAKPFVEFVHPDDRKATSKAVTRLSKGLEVIGLNTKFQCKDGSYRWLSWNSIGVVNHKLIIAAARDITERNRSEMHLQKSEDRYKRLVEYSPDAIIVHNGEKFLYVNPAAVRLLGAHNGSELLGKPLLDFVHPDYREAMSRRIKTGMLENKTLPLMERKFLRLDKATIDVEVTALPIEYDGMPAMQHVVRDITEQKKLRQELLQSHKSESIGTLAGGVAHDFNNILGIILGYTSLLEKGTLNTQELSQSVGAINQAVQRGATLVRQILTFARKTNNLFEPLNITDVLRELLSMLEQTFPKIITFKKSISKNIPLILADRAQVHQALLNLCVNARDAMPNGGTVVIKTELKTGVQLKEQFSTADQQAYVCISVTDSGEGMSEATRRRVFDPFFTTKAQGKGTGLGLSVVYGVVQAHQGFIDVESKLRHGTTFRLYFPIPNESVKPVESKKVQSFEIGGTETILLVEDEKLLVEMVRIMLKSKGYNVLVAQNGAEAVKMYKRNQQKISLVLTDMGLPVMTGIEEFKKLKEIDPGVKVIFASGFYDPNIKSELLKDGVKGFLQKPYKPDEILRTIREVLEEKK